MKNTIIEAFHKYLKDPVLEEDKLVAALDGVRKTWHEYRQNEHDPKWRTNLSFYAGMHYIRDNGRNANQYRVKLRENHTNNLVNRMVSIFVQNMPITRVMPATDDYEDVQNAETCESYMKYFWRTKKLELVYAKAVKYSAIFGNGFIFRQYDPYAGGMMQMSPKETGSDKPEDRPWRGDISVTVDDPFRINVRPGIEDMDDMFDFFRSVPGNKQELEATYGKIETDPITALNAYNGQLRTDDDLTQVHHYYHKPTHWFEGMYVCYVGKKILKATTWPYKLDKLPVEHLPFDKPPMAFWALSSIDQIIDLQEQLNRAASMIVEGRNLIARPRVLVSEEAKVPGQSFTDRPGDIVKYKQAGGKPEFYVPSFNFTEMANHKADLRNALQAVSGVSGASRGDIPAATKTALALQLVLEQDRSQWAPFIKQMYSVIQNTSLGILDIAAQYFPENDPRVIKIEQGNSVGVKTFHGGIVPSPLDVWLEDTNPLGWTAAGRIEAAQDLYAAKIITDPNTVLEMLKLNNPDTAFQFEHINRQTARKENELLNRGELVEVGSEDFDSVHLDEHVKDMVSFNYKYKADPIKKAHEDHVNQHKERMAKFAGAGAAPPGGPQIQAKPGEMPGANLAPPDVGANGIMDKLLAGNRASG